MNGDTCVVFKTYLDFFVFVFVFCMFHILVKYTNVQMYIISLFWRILCLCWYEYSGSWI